MSSISPYKEGICYSCRTEGDRSNKPLTWNLCADHYQQKEDQKRANRKPIARISEKQKAKQAEPAPRVKAEDKSLPELLELAQLVFNKAVRRLDSFDGIFCCITTGKYLPIDQMDAGHFFPVSTSSALRFELDNCHGESRQANCFDPDHLEKYKPNLINKIGLERFKALEARQHEVKHWSKEELLEIIKKYRDLSVSRLETNAA